MLGLYDGYSGLLTQPFEGAREGGVTGFTKGIGKGIGGFFLKPSAGPLSCTAPGGSQLTGCDSCMRLTWLRIPRDLQRTAK